MCCPGHKLHPPSWTQPGSGDAFITKQAAAGLDFAALRRPPALQYPSHMMRPLGRSSHNGGGHETKRWWRPIKKTAYLFGHIPNAAACPSSPIWSEAPPHGCFGPSRRRQGLNWTPRWSGAAATSEHGAVAGLVQHFAAAARRHFSGPPDHVRRSSHCQTPAPRWQLDKAVSTTGPRGGATRSMAPRRPRSSSAI